MYMICSLLLPGPRRTGQCEIKLSTREIDGMNRRCKQEIYEAVAGVSWHTILQYVFLFNK